jgi:Ca2+-binding RTX toxin-like protein
MRSADRPPTSSRAQRQQHAQGNGGADILIGGAGNDTLDGGTGADNLYGGTGNDSFTVDSASDIVFESNGEGTDTVTSSANYYLYGNIETLTLAAGAGGIFGVGNELANTITGNEGANTLLAGAGDDIVHGGAGVDIIYGQDGVDQLFGDADNDVIVGGIGNDVIDGGLGGDSLYGEDGNDTITGGTDFVFDQLVGGGGDDVLHGDSGQGDFDYLIGNAGNDSFYVDTYADLVFENAGEGIDTVYANIMGIGYYLYENIENLVLVGTTPYGVGNEIANSLTGNASANYLLGGGGNDTLNGKAGNDVLFGEAGADTFVFEHGMGGDTIGDFAAGTDRINLAAFGFTSFAQVQAAMSETGGSTAIILGSGDFIVLQGVANSALHAGDFILSGSASAAEPLVEATLGISSDPLGTGFGHRRCAPRAAGWVDRLRSGGLKRRQIAEAVTAGCSAGAWPMKARRSNSMISCSFLSKAPCSGGIALVGSRFCSTSSGISSWSSSFSQSSNSLVDGFFFRPRHVADLVEDIHRLADQDLLDAREMDVNDCLHRLAVWELDIVEEAAAQERVRQFLLVVRRDHHDRPLRGADILAGFVDVEFHAIELGQQIVGEFYVGLVDLVDQQHRQLGGDECLPELALADVIADVVDAFLAELAVAQARHRVIFVQALLRLGGRLDVPLDQRRAPSPWRLHRRARSCPCPARP